MIGKLLLLFTISFALSPNADVSQVLDNLDQEVTIQIDREVLTLSQNEAKTYLEKWMNALQNPEIIRSHPAKYEQKKDTYGLYHISSDQKSYRFFYFCSIHGSTHKINKVKIVTM